MEDTLLTTKISDPAKKTKGISALMVCLLVIAGFFAGTYVGYSGQREAARAKGVINAETPASVTADFEPFWKAWNVINEKYPSADAVDNETRVWGAIAGLADSIGDPYTAFFPPQEAKELADELEGSFGGVGMELGRKPARPDDAGHSGGNDALTVIAPLKDTPAYRAGIKAGDMILTIDGENALGFSIDEAVRLIRGEPGTKVAISVLHEGEDEPSDFTLVREKIRIPTLDSTLRDDGVFVVSLYNFSANSAELFGEAMESFRRSSSTKLILDVRGNPGGYLDAAVDMASWFLPSGVPVVIEDFGSDEPEHIYRSRGHDLGKKNVSMAILVDRGSASASEILAGALKEHGVATLVGETTYGKGSVQEVVSITPDSALKVTVAKWLTPERVSISEKGIEPNLKVGITKEDLGAGSDPQLEAAIRVVNK